MSTNKTATALILAVLGCSQFAMAQQPIVYPAKGQNQQKQNADTGDCQVWAKQNTGVDPVAVAQQMANQPPPPAPKGERVKGAVGGAVVGGVVNGGDGARAGAVVGGVAGGMKQRQGQQAAAQQQQANQQQASAAMATYNRAFGACMEGRGYTIK